jgi:hypothetical protein
MRIIDRALRTTESMGYAIPKACFRQVPVFRRSARGRRLSAASAPPGRVRPKGAQRSLFLLAYAGIVYKGIFSPEAMMRVLLR